MTPPGKQFNSMVGTCCLHEFEGPSEFTCIHAAEGELSVRVSYRGRRLEGYSDFVGTNQPLSECVVGDGGDTRAGVRNQCSCVMRE